ncbi:GtrA family protein [Aeromicrobium sp.]|nr:GtrA family protein [Candidatus Saccharibacteria bacterium]
MKALLQRRFVRYLLVGGSVYVLELGVILVGQGAGLSAVPAVAIAFCVGLVVSFILQKFVTFGDKRTHHKVLLRQTAAVTALVVWNFAFTIALTKLLEGHIAATITRTVALLITTLWNFQLYKASIFRGAEEPLY